MLDAEHFITSSSHKGNFSANGLFHHGSGIQKLRSQIPTNDRMPHNSLTCSYKRSDRHNQSVTDSEHGDVASNYDKESKVQRHRLKRRILESTGDVYLTRQDEIQIVEENASPASDSALKLRNASSASSCSEGQTDHCHRTGDQENDIDGRSKEEEFSIDDVTDEGEECIETSTTGVQFLKRAGDSSNHNKHGGTQDV